MRVLICSVDVDPCPAASVGSLAMVDVFNPQALGITPDSMLYVYAWGVSSVLILFSLGYTVGVCVGLIRKV